MIKADLSYNPYVNETIISFNGKKPRINSLVEKYQDKMLQEWINKLPFIFRNEMNGYNFELDFSGTELDCNELKKAFIMAGVTEDLVPIFHKKELDSRKKKVEEIYLLLQWFKDNPNRKFDYISFYEKNRELFEDDYMYVFLHGEDIDQSCFDDIDISVENVGTPEELDNTNLRNTPLLYCLDRTILPNLQEELEYLLAREDVSAGQLFFIIHNDLNYDKAERLIKDLGISNPKIIEDPYDNEVKKYFELYPITDFIYSADTIIKDEYNHLKEMIERENKQSEIENREIHFQIDKYEESLYQLNKTLGAFINRDNLDIPDQFNDDKDYLYNTIKTWQKRRTKITNTADAESYAVDLNALLHKEYRDFMTRIDDAAIRVSEDIKDGFQDMYEKSGFKILPDLTTIVLASDPSDDFPSVSDSLLSLKEENYVTPKDLLGRFFKSSDNSEKSPVLEVTYYFQKWRDYSINTIEPLTENYIKYNFHNQ